MKLHVSGLILEATPMSYFVFYYSRARTCSLWAQLGTVCNRIFPDVYLRVVQISGRAVVYFKVHKLLAFVLLVRATCRLTL
jgi:hypothetical protein